MKTMKKIYHLLMVVLAGASVVSCQNFLSANLKKMIIGGVVGAVIACGLWFLAGLAPEFSKGRKAEEYGKEAAAK